MSSLLDGGFTRPYETDYYKILVNIQASVVNDSLDNVWFQTHLKLEKKQLYDPRSLKSSHLVDKINDNILDHIKKYRRKDKFIRSK